jgi:anaerobic magnesium-protoporphyrin IX monomethyl ester cyclase
MDVLLVNSTWKYGQIARGIQFFPPIGLNYLAGSLERKDLKVGIVDLGAQPFTVEDLNDLIKRENVRLVGFSSISPQIHTTMRFVRAIRDRFKDEVSIALGGFHLSNDPDFINRYPEIDFGVIGDGDITFVDLAKRTLGGEKIKGVFKGELPESLDDLPPPAYHLTPLERYKDLGLSFYPLLGTRGCPFDCVFCSRAFMSRKVRFRSPQLLIEEMERSYDLFGGNYVFLDESFTLRRRHVLEFCQLIKDWGKKITWNAGALRLDQVDEELMTQMWESGCRGFFVGVESGSERVRNQIIGKNVTDEQMYNAFRVFDKLGMNVELSFVLGNPTETEEELKQTVYLPVKLKKMGFKCISQIGFKIAVPMPGSRLWNIAIEEDKIPKNFIDRYINYEFGEDFWRVWPKYAPEGMTVDTLRYYRKKGNLAYYLRPGYVARRLLKSITNFHQLKSDYTEMMSMLKTGHSTVSMTD